MFIYSRTDPTCNRPEKVMNYQNLQNRKVKCFKAADCTNSNDFVNAVNDLLKKYIDLIHDAKNYLESGGKGPQTLLHLLSTIDRVDLATANKKQHQIR